MSLLPNWKTCPKCHKKYSLNPDVGHFFCPHCHGLGKGKENIFDKLLKKKRDISGDMKEE